SCTHSASFLLYRFAHPPVLPSFPTRRSSDLPRDSRRMVLPRPPRTHRRCALPPRRLPHPPPPSRAVRAGRSRVALCRPRRTRSRSEEHTSELQSRENLVCRLLLEKKKKKSAQ